MKLEEAKDNLIMLKYFLNEEKEENYKDYTKTIETVLQALEEKQKDTITINKKDLKEKIDNLRKYRKIGNLSEIGKMQLDIEISILEGLFEGFFKEV